MNKRLSKVDQFNLTLGKKFFRNFNLFTYNIFNMAYKLFISNKNVPYLKNYISLGHQQLKEIPDKYLNNLILNLNYQNDFLESKKIEFLNNGYFEFTNTEEIKKSVLNIINEPLKSLVENLKQFYNSNIVLSSFRIVRNFHINEENDIYSNFFHNDKYVCTLIKVFINLHDVGEDNGPMRFINKKDSKKVLKNMSDDEFIRLQKINDKQILNYNIGKKGGVFICDTTSLIHAAGIPEKGKTRDILFLEFCAYPKKKKLENLDISNFEKITYPDQYLSKIISKPAGIKNLFKYFLKYI